MIPNSSPAAKHTLCKKQIMRIKDELRFLHMKKQQINLKLYRLHLSLANTWGNSCFEKSEYKTQKPCNNPEETMQHSEHGESLF